MKKLHNVTLIFFLISRWYTSPGSKAHSSSQQPGNAVSRFWSLTQRAVRHSTTQTSKPPGVALKFILGPAALTVSARLFCHVAYCEADENNNIPVEVVAKNPVPEFKWHILWEFVKPQLFALLGAVVVSLKISSPKHTFSVYKIKYNVTCLQTKETHFSILLSSLPFAQLS